MKAVMKYPGSLSTHDLTQRSTGVSSHQPFILSFFNSRPHAEVDRMGHIQYGTMILFNSRPHAEVDQNRINLWTQLAIFNSRPHAEVDHRKACCTLRGYLFNSRPHAEVDKAARKGGCMRKFSTHDLTQRSTTDYGYFDNQAGFSTHDLTQRSTWGNEV